MGGGVVMTTTTLDRTQEATKEVVKHGAIAVGIGFLYYLMLVFNPLTGLTGVASLANFASIRWANILRAFVVVSPGAVVGIAMGSYAYNVQTGRILLGAYSAVTVSNMIIGILCYLLIKAIGRSTVKDLAVIALYGLGSGIVVTLNLTTMAVLFDGSNWSLLFTGAALWKIFTHITVPLLGYPLVRYVESVVKK